MVSYLATATLAVSLLTSTPQLPHWEADYGDALAATRAGDQPLLVVIDSPRDADARVEPARLSEGSIEGEEYELLRPYRLCHIDATTKYGQQVAEVFAAKSLPHVAIIDKTGSVILYSKSGQMASGDWQRILSTYKDGRRASSVVSHASYPQPASIMFQEPTRGYTNNAYCPSCQRNSF